MKSIYKVGIQIRKSKIEFWFLIQINILPHGIPFKKYKDFDISPVLQKLNVDDPPDDPS